uniref:Uncharacterized protein n=1 Tax=viral metagenome TaxID=1070528 RepID=A0A6C0JUF9_9ZZZZ
MSHIDNQYKLVYDKCMRIIRDQLYAEYDSVYRMDMIEWLEDGKKENITFTCKGMFWDKTEIDDKNI